MHLAGSTVRGQQDAMQALYLLRHTYMYVCMALAVSL